MFCDVVKCPRRFKDDVDDALIFAQKSLDIGEDAYIYVDFKDDIEDNFSGFAIDCGHGEYIIEIYSRLSKSDTIKTLFHELVHVEQRETGALVKCETGTMWFGREIECTYEDSPWEKDAYAMEERLYKAWMKKKKSNSLSASAKRWAIS